MIDRTHIKICGLRAAEHARVALDAGADLVGLVFHPASPRHVEVAEAQAVAEAVAGRLEVVGLFVDAPVGRVIEVAGAVGLTMVQLHGDVDEAAVQALAPLPVLACVRFDARTAEADMRRWEAAAASLENLAGVLWDTPDPAKAGGTGRTFDWRQLRRVLDRVNPHVPAYLAGGLKAENVAKAIHVVGPHTVDVSSGVESAPGVKDAAKIRAFCEAVRAADEEADEAMPG